MKLWNTFQVLKHYYNKDNRNKKAHRSHPQKRKRSECGEQLDSQTMSINYNKIYKSTKQDNSVSDCIPSGLLKSTLAQFHDNMRL